MTESDQNLFVEQAEYIDEDSFLKWSAEHPDEETIIRKLSQGGAKLITGPRGCGKTTLILKTYYKLRDTHGASALPIYVNFKSSLKLEPLYVNTANAAFWFNQWLLFKVYDGMLQTLTEMNIAPPAELQFTRDAVEKITSYLELGRTNISLGEEQLLTTRSIEEDISKVLSITGKHRCVLFLDDAAHAFSPEQQRDFFDFFRQIKSKLISPKAAIYPGVTIYSSSFHLGHDAEEVDIWIKPDSNGYIEFMFELLERRLPQQVFEKLSSNEPLLRLVCYASFGMPRALLNMVRNFYRTTSNKGQLNYRVAFTSALASQEIKTSFESTYAIFNSLKIKLPIYAQFIEAGSETYERMVQTIKEYNKGREIDRQSLMIAIKRPLPAELSKVLGFFQYGGLLLPKGEKSRGHEGVYELYTIHYAALIERNAILGRASISVADIVHAFDNRFHLAYTRTTPTHLIGTNAPSEVFPLSLPPCHVCRTPRTSEQAKFCLNCGAQLKTASIFDSVVNQDIQNLPLTVNRVRRIKAHSRIKTVRDILMDHENRELRGVPQVGPYWAKRIYSYAEEYIA